MATEDVKPSVTLIWRIENISHWEPEFHRTEIHSPTFIIRTMDGKQWFLRLLRQAEDTEHLRLSLRLFDRPLGYPIDLECSILDTNGLPLVTGTVKNQTADVYRPIILPVCPTREEVFVSRKCLFLPEDTLTVQCRMRKSRGELERSEHIFLLSRIEVQETSFLWPIDQFSSFRLGQAITAPVPLIFPRENLMFWMRFLLSGTSLQDSSVSFEIIAHTKSETSIATHLNVSVLEKTKRVMKCMKYGSVFYAQNRKRSWIARKVGQDMRRTWIAPKFVSREELLANRSECLHNDVLTLLCKFTVVRAAYSKVFENIYYIPPNLNNAITGTTIISETSCRIPPQNGDSLQVCQHPVFDGSTRITRSSTFPDVRYETLPQRADICQQRSDSLAVLGSDFHYLYKEHTFSDFELRSNGASFPVHKIVLSARSPVFRSMFSSHDSDAGFLDIQDVDAHVLNLLLSFLYTGTVEQLQWNDAVKLYYAACKYQVTSLKNLCTSVLLSNMTKSNVCDVLVLADRYQEEELTASIHAFILMHLDDIMNSEEWENFLHKDPHVAGKTMHQICKKKNQFLNN